MRFYFLFPLYWVVYGTVGFRKIIERQEGVHPEKTEVKSNMNQSKVLVAGTGISGIAAARLVLERGGEVVLYDGNTALDPAEIRKKFKEEDKVGIVLGEIKRSDLLGVETLYHQPRYPFKRVLLCQ